MEVNPLVGGQQWARELTSTHDRGRGLHWGGEEPGGVPLSSSRNNPHRPSDSRPCRGLPQRLLWPYLLSGELSGEKSPYLFRFERRLALRQDNEPRDPPPLSGPRLWFRTLGHVGREVAGGGDRWCHLEASSTRLERALPAQFSQQHLQGTHSFRGKKGGGPRYLCGSPERFTVLANITFSPGELTGSSEIINN